MKKKNSMETVIVNPKKLSRLMANELMSKKELCIAAGLSRSCVQKIFKDQPISIKSVQKIMSALDIDNITMILSDEIIKDFKLDEPIN